MYVINPVVFYLIGVVNSLLPILLIGSIIFIFVIPHITFSKIDYYTSDKDKEKSMNIVKKSIILGIVLIFIWIIIPSKETIIQMLIAKNITVDKVQIGKDIVEKVYNDIIKIISR